MTMTTETNEDNNLELITKKNKDKLTIPDGGWGWVVLISAFVIRVIMSGIYVSFALFTKDFVIEFKMSPSVMGWMISIYSAISYLIAPVASVLAVKFGFRIVSIVGLLIAGLAYPAVYFYPTLWFTFLTASIIVPASQGLALMCANVILTVYFDKHLPIAMGVYSCGSGVASFLITPIMSLIIEKFGWSLSKVMYSLLYLVAALCALTFRPINSKSIDEEMDEEEQKETLKTEIIDTSFFGSKDSNIFNYISMANITSNLSIADSTKKFYTSLQNMKCNQRPVNKSEVNVVNVPLSALVALSVASNLQIKVTADSMNETNFETFVKDEVEIVNEKPKPTGYLKLLTKPIFLIFLFSNLFTNLGYDTPYVYTKIKALEMGNTEIQATFLLTCLGIGNIIGRLGFGFLGAKKQINQFWLYTSCLIASGSFVIMSRVAFSYPLMIVYAVGFGIFIGGYVTLAQVMLIEILDVSDFSNGLSLMFVAQAIGLFSGAPISGLIFDATKSFNWPFLYCGFIILASGLLLSTGFVFKQFREKQKTIK
uniref:Slc16a-21 n=1 Tax=Schmidtea mediterranea TaxID=79327 RepID=A0A0H3YJ10_SCHMD|nr:slc16a-21 [Schmidtea mediterranea]